MTPESLRIRSSQGEYAVHFQPSIVEVVKRVMAVEGALFVVDRKVADAYRDALAPVLAADPLLIDATEEEKSLDGVGKVAAWLLSKRANRNTMMVVIGGGVTQDLASFTAHIYHRGMRWVFVPTTLLAMSDSCIGAKNGINFSHAKNQLGAFHSPAAVHVCVDFIRTLNAGDVASGFGEVLKLALTGSEALFADLAGALDRDGMETPELPRLIQACLAVKKRFIEEDEYDTGVRRQLNYGHTFGHALESLTSHEVPHGQAVAWGCDLINFLAVRRGLLEEPIRARIHGVIQKHFACRLPRAVNAKELVAAAKTDKKVAGGAVSLVFLERPGTLSLHKTFLDEALEAQVAEYLERHDVFRPA